MDFDDASFGYRIIAESSPDLAFDLDQLPDTVAAYGSLDEIALELEVMGSGDATYIRTAALRWFAQDLIVSTRGAGVESMMYRIASNDQQMAVWCLRECLTQFSPNRLLQLESIKDVLKALHDWVSEDEDLRLAYLVELANRRSSGVVIPNLRDMYMAISSTAMLTLRGQISIDYGREASNAIRQILNIMGRRGFSVDQREDLVREAIVTALPGMPVRVR